MSFHDETSNEVQQDVVIVGGGISGLATALALQNAGKVRGKVDAGAAAVQGSDDDVSTDIGCMKNIRNIHVIEKSNMKSFLSLTKGAGAQLTPNGLRALQYIDNGNGNNESVLMNQVIDSSCCLEGSAFIPPSPPNRDDGDRTSEGQEQKQDYQQKMTFVKDTTMEEFGLPQVFIRWGLLRHILYSSIVNNNKSTEGSCPNVIFHTNAGKEIIGYKINDEDGSVSLISKSRSKVVDDINSKSIRFIIGADGLSSTFRYLVNNSKQIISLEDIGGDGSSALQQIDVKDTGRINIKAVVQKELDIKKGYKPNHTFAHFTTNGIGIFAGSAGNGYTYWAISISDHIDNETGEELGFLSKTINEWRKQRNDDDINDDRDGSEEIDILYQQKVKEELLCKLQNLDCAEDAQFAIDLIEATDARLIYLTRSQEARKIGPTLFSKDQRCVLVGDAAHCMSGSYGQNPVLGLEDAAVLAACLRDSGTLSDALYKFSECRVTRCLEIQHRSAERAAKAMKGEKAEDVSKWIFSWKLNQN